MQMSTRNIVVTSLVCSLFVAGCGGDADPVPSSPANDPPTVDAGPDLSVDEGDFVQLVGQGNDPEGDTLTFTWTQVSGPRVTLSSTSDPEATFEAPEVPVRNAEPVILSLSVSDTAGDTAADEISINVASTDYVLFIKEVGGFGEDELYRYDPETDSLSILSGPMVAGGEVSGFSISPDGQWVAYLADQETNSTSELFVAAADGSSINKVSGTLPPNGDVRPGFEWSPDSSSVAFFADSVQARRDDLFIVDPAGVNLRRIDPIDTQLPLSTALEKPIWSPDGRFLAQVERSLTENVVLGINLYDTRSATPQNVRVTPTLPTGFAVGGTRYDWSPDGSRIAYTASLDTVGVTELYTVQADGSDNRRVSLPISTGESIGRPHWSPDGTRIAYSRAANLATDIDLYSVRPDGAGNTKISSAPVENFSGTPFWSPDGSYIAYLTEPDASGTFEIVSVRPDGSESRSVSGPLVLSTPGNLPLNSPVWSPDSAKIAFVASLENSGPVELYTVDPDGQNRVKASGPLVPGGDLSIYPFWSPDSAWLAYMADQETDGVIEMFTVRPDGSDNVKINGPVVASGNAGGPIWSPDGSRIVYGADQDIDNVHELFMSTPDGLLNVKISGQLNMDGDVLLYEWSP